MSAFRCMSRRLSKPRNNSEGKIYAPVRSKSFLTHMLVSPDLYTSHNVHTHKKIIDLIWKSELRCLVYSPFIFTDSSFFRVHQKRNYAVIMSPIMSTVWSQASLHCSQYRLQGSSVCWKKKESAEDVAHWKLARKSVVCPLLQTFGTVSQIRKYPK